MKYILIGLIIALVLALTSFFLLRSLVSLRYELEIARNAKDQQKIYYEEIADAMEKEIRILNEEVRILDPRNRGK